ncbi:MAG: DNA polymerase I, partial [Deltaproteobacteria bacterium]|nr:DNA polymerase I [Deltaproteobacteria bacterium]
KPDYLAVATDSPEATFRHRMYAPYKATREKMPEELVAQLPYIPRVMEALGLPYLALPGYEADDIIGTLAAWGEAAGLETHMVTGDKDFMQLITPRTFMFSVKGDETIRVGEPQVLEKFGCTPAGVVQVLALMGDASDNVPGVKGGGEKTAVKLIQQYHTLEGVYDHLGEIPGKLGEKLAQDRDQAFLSRDLVTIHRQVPIAAGLEDFKTPQGHLAENRPFIALLTELEFQQFRDKLLAAGGRPSQPGQGTQGRTGTQGGAESQGGAGIQGQAGGPSLGGHSQVGHSQVGHSQGGHSQQLLFGEEESGQEEPGAPGGVAVDILDSLEAVAGRLAVWGGANLLAFDTETTGLDILADKLVGISLAVEEGRAVYIPFNHPDLAPRKRDLLALLAPLLQGDRPPKCGHNIKFDMHIMLGEGILLGGLAHDTMIASHLLEPAERRHDLDSVALRRLGVRKIPTESLLGKGRDQTTMDRVEIPRVALYAGEDAEVTLRLARQFAPRLEETGQQNLFQQVEMRLLPVLVRMEREGVRFDREGAAEVSREMETRLESIREEIHQLAGERDFNINSILDMQKILYEKLRLHEVLKVRPRKIKTGLGFSTDEETLEKLSGHPLPRALLAYRELTKLKNTYLDQLPGFIKPSTGRIHTSFRQAVAATGRLASDNPNLQNVPVRSEEGRKVRALFLAGGPDRVLLSADYSQIELRVAADYSQDPTFLQAFREGQDIHSLTAQAIFQVGPDEVTREMRSVSKEVNFGLIYRMGADRLALVTGTGRDEAKDFIDRFFTRYAAVRLMQDDLMEKARKEGYATTRLGRRRYLPDIHSGGLAGRAA